MSRGRSVVAGIDVGGPRKGFHAVLLVGGRVADATAKRDAAAMAAWCREVRANIIAVDAPCGWSVDSGSRACERALAREGIRCFATPMRERADGNPFYDWVRNGLALYEALNPSYRLFDGRNHRGRCCFETFPQAVVCVLEGRVVPARPKAERRRRILEKEGLDSSRLVNQDFLDAALCAVAARCFAASETRCFGNAREGVIVTPC